MRDATVAIAIMLIFGACAGDGASEAGAAVAGAGGAGGSVQGGASGAGGAGGVVQAGVGGAGGSVQEGAGGVSGVSAGQGGAPDVDAGQAGVSTDAASADAGSALPRLPVVSSVEMDGPFETMEDLASGPHGESGIFRPTELGAGDLRHPILVWGCGGGSQPSSYAAVLHRVASHGFVVIAEVSMIGDDGDVLTASLDWILAENERPDGPFFGKLDPANVAAGGHSIGSVNTFLMADDPRLRTTIHVAGGSLDNVNDPFAPTTGMGGRALVHPTALICSESDLFGNVEKTEKDFAAATAPVFFTVMSGTEHVGAATDGLPAIVGWLRWHLGGETERSAMFLEASGAFQIGKYVSQIKNW